MVLIDVLLTPENALDHGYQWVTDLLPAIIRGEIRDIEDLEIKQLWRMGKSKMTNGVLGLYKPKVSEKLLDFSVDETLNPENAYLIGYRWVDDFVYIASEKMGMNLYEVMKSLVEDGFKIGKARKPISDEDKGWYAPMRQRTEKVK